MKLLLFLAFVFVPLSCCFCDIEKKIETNTKNDAQKSPVSQTITLTKDGSLVYRAFQAIDPQLIGSAMPPLKESFYVDGHLILTIYRFPNSPKIQFNSYEDFSVKATSPFSEITATSPKRKVIWIWKEDDAGLLTKFEAQPFPKQIQP
jgi:hypothetical protein